MDYWQGVASRISVPGVILLLIGAALSFGAQKIALLLFKDGQKTLPIKLIGLLLVIVGALTALL